MKSRSPIWYLVLVMKEYLIIQFEEIDIIQDLKNPLITYINEEFPDLELDREKIKGGCV